MSNEKTLLPGSNCQKGVAVWLTGLSGSGKTTITIPLCEKLEAMGYRVQRMDGDVVRQKLTRDLGFSKEDRDKNIERVTFVAERLVKHGIITVCAFIFTPCLCTVAHFITFFTKSFSHFLSSKSPSLLENKWQLSLLLQL